MCGTPVDFSHGQGHPYTQTASEVSVGGTLGKHRLIFLARDPRDVIVSSFFERNLRGHHWEKSRSWRFWRRPNEHNYSYDGPLKNYLYEERGSLATLLEYLDKWTQFAMDKGPHGLIIRYEDVIQDPTREFSRILNFLGEPVVSEKLHTAINVAKFDNMRKIETGESNDIQFATESKLATSRSLQPGNPDDENSYKVRRGGHGGFVDYLDDEDIEYINRLVAERPLILEEPLGYKPLSDT